MTAWSRIFIVMSWRTPSTNSDQSPTNSRGLPPAVVQGPTAGGRPEAAHRVDDRGAVDAAQVAGDPGTVEQLASGVTGGPEQAACGAVDRKSTRLNSSHRT